MHIKQRFSSEFRALATVINLSRYKCSAQGRHPQHGIFPPGLWTHNSLANHTLTAQTLDQVLREVLPGCWMERDL